MTLFAREHKTNASMNGAVEYKSVFFLPIESAAIPATNGPNVAPRGKNEPIHASSSRVIFVGNGFTVVSFEYNFGIMGDVQPNA